MSRPADYDSGLMPERTQLSWGRTVLALLVGGLLALRVLPPRLGAWSFGASLVILALTGVVWVLARRRTAAVGRALRDAGELPGGGLLLLVALLLSGTAALALAYVVTR